LVKLTSDHAPRVIAIEINIPRSPFFRFENYWLHHSFFKEIVQNAWNILVDHSDSARRINAKFIPEKKSETMGKKNILSQANNFTS
jgi:hypothetical protein